ncbi:DUF1269 domain-containing protein [Thiolapillus sp.]|uniref:DUF1269 domain-containing protein n=1 Tax=Thiolapillus sp. TaxID=2017437 RepID=UPI003AF6E2E1
MADLIVITYDDVHQAEEVRLKLLKMQKEYLVDLEDAVIAVKDKNGKIKLQQMYDLTATGAMTGGFLGILIGVLFLNPLLGFVVGSASGALGGALSDAGINDKFMKELAANIQEGKSVLFILVRKATPDKVLEELRGMGGKILQTSLTHEEEKKLQEALDAAKAGGGD